MLPHGEMKMHFLLSPFHLSLSFSFYHIIFSPKLHELEPWSRGDFNECVHFPVTLAHGATSEIIIKKKETQTLLFHGFFSALFLFFLGFALIDYITSIWRVVLAWPSQLVSGVFRSRVAWESIGLLFGWCGNLSQPAKTKKTKKKSKKIKRGKPKK